MYELVNVEIFIIDYEPKTTSTVSIFRVALF